VAAGFVENVFSHRDRVVGREGPLLFCVQHELARVLLTQLERG